MFVVSVISRDVTQPEIFYVLSVQGQYSRCGVFLPWRPMEVSKITRGECSDLESS
jgi:hypothetical protein